MLCRRVHLSDMGLDHVLGSFAYDSGNNDVQFQEILDQATADSLESYALQVKEEAALREAMENSLRISPNNNKKASSRQANNEPRTGYTRKPPAAGAARPPPPYRPRASAPRNNAAGRQRLARDWESDFTMIPIEGDGKCFYRAIARGLSIISADEWSPERVIRDMLEYAEARKACLSEQGGMFVTPEDITDAVAKLRAANCAGPVSGNNWAGDGIFFIIAVNVFCVTINVCNTPNAKQPWSTFEPRMYKIDPFQKQHVYLHYDGSHYSVLKPR